MFVAWHGSQWLITPTWPPPRLSENGSYFDLLASGAFALETVLRSLFASTGLLFAPRVLGG
jgi:hypothetical protein